MAETDLSSPGENWSPNRSPGDGAPELGVLVDGSSGRGVSRHSRREQELWGDCGAWVRQKEGPWVISSCYIYLLACFGTSWRGRTLAAHLCRLPHNRDTGSLAWGPVMEGDGTAALAPGDSPG